MKQVLSYRPHVDMQPENAVSPDHLNHIENGHGEAFKAFNRDLKGVDERRRWGAAGVQPSGRFRDF